MNHEEYERMVNYRRTAINKFPSLFKNCHLKKDATLDELDKLYNSYISAQMQDAISYWELREIRRAYDYIKDLIENRYIPSYDKFSTSTYEAYHLLINEIGKYHFLGLYNYQYLSRKSRFQNSNNEEILFELSLLEPYFNSLLKWLDDIYKLSNEEKKKKIREKTFQYDMFLLDSSGLYNSRNWYNDEKQSKNYREVGKAKKAWKKARNRACHDILEFYERFIYELKAPLYIKKIYNRFLKELKRSPHYYCFLTEEEINKQSKKKKENKYYYPTGNKEIDELIKRDSRGKYKVKKRIRQ